MVCSRTYEFLFVKSGDYVVIKNEKFSDNTQNDDDYWIGQVINCIGGARNPNSWTLFQVANIDNGEIIIINADTVERILKTSEELNFSKPIKITRKSFIVMKKNRKKKYYY